MDHESTAHAGVFCAAVGKTTMSATNTSPTDVRLSGVNPARDGPWELATVAPFWAAPRESLKKDAVSIVAICTRGLNLIIKKLRIAKFFDYEWTVEGYIFLMHKPEGQGAGRRILIVEDDSVTRMLLKSVLEGGGFEVQAAPNAARGREQVRTFDPDGAIVDIDLGEGSNGYDFAYALSRLHPHVGVMFLTNLPRQEFLAHSFKGFPRTPGFLNKLEISDADKLLANLEDCLRPTPQVRPAPTEAGLRLTRIQKEVVQMVGLGLSNAQISEQRDTSLRATEMMLRRLQKAHPSLLLDSKYTRANSAQDFMIL